MQTNKLSIYGELHLVLEIIVLATTLTSSLTGGSSSAGTQGQQEAHGARRHNAV